MAHVPVSYSGSFYVASLSIAWGGGDFTHMSGIADISMQWQRKIGLWKPLDENSPVIVFGKHQGQLKVSGLATIAVSGVPVPEIDIDLGSVDIPAVTATVTAKTSSVDVGTSVSYTGYLTGKGFSMRKVDERVWVMDGDAFINLAS